ISVTAIDPATYLSVLHDALDDPDPTLAPLAELQPGQVVLSAAGAELRGLGVGGRLDIGEAVELEVVAVLDDPGARRSEVFAHTEDAEVLGLGDTGSIAIRHGATTPEQRHGLEAHLAALSTDDTIRLRGGDPGSSVPLVLSLAQIKQTFGEFSHRPRGGRDIQLDREFLREHIVTTRIPVFDNVTCHRRIIDDLVAAIEEVVDAGLEEHLAPSRYGGCHHPRRISLERGRLSSHSWGIAIDINVDVDAPGLGPVPPDEFIAIFGRHGFRWGGDFTSPDNHHYEWIGDDAALRPER
ncbi:MAG: M15 family metallopeptidase, partial [Nitriliruptoraceae bacterium]